MQYTALPLAGAFVLDPDRLADERGFFARTWCATEFAARGLDPKLVQCSISFNKRAGTVRGMHYQAAPHEEVKLVRCTRGAIHDVIVDVRPDSPTYLKWEAVELTADNRRLLYIPGGFAHGFQTLADDTEVFYQMAEYFHPESARGLRWDDPALGLTWPRPVSVIAAKDTSFPLLGAGRA